MKGYNAILKNLFDPWTNQAPVIFFDLLQISKVIKPWMIVLIIKGLKRSKIFSWEKCASKTLEVYNELLNS